MNIGDESVFEPSFVAWAAGFFDGEGCVSAALYRSRSGEAKYRFSVVVAQADRRPLDALQARWGGSIRPVRRAKPHHRDQWRWVLEGSDGAAFLRQVQPYLRVKAEVARAAEPVMFRTHRHGVPFTPLEHALREQAALFIRRANHRGEAAA